MMRRQQKEAKELEPKVIFAKFLDFLSSSVWAIPIATFIEQRSLVFDREQGDPSMYNEIHSEFASLVDTLIECFCDDLQIKPELLVAALKHKDNCKALNLRERMLLEPVVAAQDFDVFVPMMMRKNVELQLQALQMIEFMCGLIPTVLQLEGEEFDDEDLAQLTKRKFSIDPEDSDRYILVQVLRQSKLEFEQDEAHRKEAQMELEEAMRESLREKERLEAIRQAEDNALNEALGHQLGDGVTTPTKKESVERRNSKENETKRRPATSKSRPPTAKERTAAKEDGSASSSEATKSKGRTAADIHALLKEPTRIASADIRQRAEYLRAQRDKLVALKKAERVKQLQASEKAASERPKTAKVARGAMEGQISRGGPVNEDILAARRALAYKLKNEVVKP